MANVKLLFSGTERSRTEETSLKLYSNAFNEIFIEIESDSFQHICLDKSTAIKLHRELKKHISFLEGEVCNG